MGPDLQIAVNDSHRLLVSSPEMFFWWVTGAVFVLETLGFFYVARTLNTPSPKTKQTAQKILYAAPLVSLLIQFLVLGWTNTSDIRWSDGTATITNKSLLGISRAHVVELTTVSHASIAVDREGPTIVLDLKNGEQVLPLGIVAMYKPSQVKVVQAINNGLRGYVGATDSNHSSEELFPSYYKMLREQKEWEAKLKAQKQPEPSPQPQQSGRTANSR